MMFRTAVKQLLRTPWKTLLFFLLLALSAGLLVVGANLYYSCAAALREVEASYETVGTITQAPDGTEIPVYDLGNGTTISTGYEEDVFTTILPEDVLEGLPGLLPVENRPTLISTGVKEDGTELITASPLTFGYILTFTPMEDVDSDDPEFMDEHFAYSGFTLMAYINGFKPYEELEQPGSAVLYWPMDLASYPIHLKAGTTYVAHATLGYGQGAGEGNLFFLSALTLENDATKTGMEQVSADQVAYELTPDFWETDMGKAFLRYQENIDLFTREYGVSPLFPTVPTNSLSLLDPFYRGTASVKYGREITAAEFASGAKVCMVPETLARDLESSGEGNGEFSNYLEVGDTIDLTWYGACYGVTTSSLFPGRGSGGAEFFSAQPLTQTAGGEYEIVGIYSEDASGFTSDADLYTSATAKLGYNQVIVPAASFGFDSLPTLLGGPLDDANVSFQLENGTAGEFMAAVEQSEYRDYLSVTINDKGFTSVKKGLDAVSLAAALLLGAGAVSALCLLVFFVYLQIGRKKREAAIQVSLGTKRRQAAAFLLCSVLLAAALAIAAGAAGGYVVTGKVSGEIYQQGTASGFSREYSDLFDASQDQEYAYDGSPSPQATAGAGLALFFTGAALSIGFAAYVLKQEPMALLTQE